MLDLNHALVFSLDTNCIGYIYFRTANKYQARFDGRLIEKTESGIRELAEIVDGLVSVAAGSSRNVIFQAGTRGSVSISWLPPTSLFVLDDVRLAAIVSVADIRRIDNWELDFIKWAPVTVPDR
ncbi:MAG: hypothetical protein WCL44_08625 [bacterium]